MVKIALVGHFVKDYWIRVKEGNDFLGYNSEFSIDEVLNLASKNGDEVGTAFGGPALTWAQYLIPNHEVSPISVLGNDSESTKLKDLLDQIPNLITEGIKGYGGRLPRFVTVFPETPYTTGSGKVKWKKQIYWEGRIADKTFPNVEISPSFLGQHDVLILPITEPTLALQAAESYLSRNPSGKIVYNPGRYLLGFGLTFEQTNFRKISAISNSILVNQEEANVVQPQMHIGGLQHLFSSCPRLEIIAHTKDSKGSEIFERKTSQRYIPARIHPQSLDSSYSLGAGDAFGATFHSKLYNGFSIDEALNCATAAAEETLTFQGAFNRRRLIDKDYSSPNVDVRSFRLGI